ncbi:MAG: hypothetical protein KGI25_05385 [Thaumarchaeota archaeon]|nr:hypothetical protein [Nitrososphaerota archaeon]
MVVEDETPELAVEEDSPIEPDSDITGLDSTGADVGLDDSLVDWTLVAFVAFDEVIVMLVLVCVAFEDGIDAV